MSCDPGAFYNSYDKHEIREKNLRKLYTMSIVAPNRLYKARCDFSTVMNIYSLGRELVSGPVVRGH